MAPKRGGGSSGGGGSGPSGIEDTPWGNTTELPSFFGFGDPYNVARLVFQAIGLIGILAILIAAKTFKKHHELNKKLFKWWAFWLSAVALFVSVHLLHIPSRPANGLPAPSPSNSPSASSMVQPTRSR